MSESSTPPSEVDPTETDPAEGDDKRMSLFDHLSELRQRLRNSFIIFVLSLIVAFVFKRRLYEILTRPVRVAIKHANQDVRFVILAPGEAFWVFFKLSVFVGLIIAAPLIFWELWKFVAPGLYKKEKKLALLVVGSTALCFLGGAVFGYYVLMEPAIYFLVSLTETVPADAAAGIPNLEIDQMMSMEKVAGFATMMLLGCGIAFELPVVVSLMGALSIVSARGLWNFNKYSLVLSALLGGILTPGGDVVSQMLLAGPIFALYNLSILVVMLIEKSRKKQEAAMDAEYGSEPFER